MANSSCVCVFAAARLPETDEIEDPSLSEQNKNHKFTINVFVSLGSVPLNPVTITSPMICWNKWKTFQYPRKPFVSANQASKIISEIIQALQIPFRLENVHWGLNLHTNQTASTFENIAGRLSDMARDCAEKNDSYMDIHIQKVDTVSRENYQEILAEKEESYRRERRQPLDDWILENQNDVRLRRENCLGVIHKLALESTKDYKYFGLKSVMIEEELGKEEMCNCSICAKSLKKGLQAIQLPCSHIFHGFCVFERIAVDSTCPRCCVDLFTNSVDMVD